MRAGRCGPADDAQIASGYYQDVAVDSDLADHGVMECLACGGGASGGALSPQCGEALRGFKKLVYETAHGTVIGVAGELTVQIADQITLIRSLVIDVSLDPRSPDELAAAAGARRA